MLADPFHCQRIVKVISSNGTSTTLDESIVNGDFVNFFTGECCFEYHRKKRSISTLIEVMFYEFEVSVSNDGNNFGEAVTLHVYDSSCQEYFTDIKGRASVHLKDGMCLIDNECVKENDVRINDYCYKCLPSSNRFNWTHDCDDKDKNDDNNTLIYIIVSAVCGAVIIILIVICIVKMCITKKITRIDSNVSGDRRYEADRCESGYNNTYYNEHDAGRYENDNSKPYYNEHDAETQYQTLSSSTICMQDCEYNELQNIQTNNS
ncbi:uncharacterized protein LOC132721216 [Ruditapes philippinarum]|uniref:uncharacterized protein LOC132721216 n=1 Tax=Ruditapes philippinarum TaxID=129788 RepID=UPI00295C179C|nr:uncharacterized protein LOC132721216 [Ruditapes philippinarum]